MKKRPGKFVSPLSLREAREKAWAALMNEARTEALAGGMRRRVVAVKSARRGWVYVIQCTAACMICDDRRAEARRG